MMQTETTDVRDMHAVHTMFRREYSLMPGLVRDVPAGDTGRIALVAEHITLLNSVLHHHHQGEDEMLWPRLLKRAPSECDPLVELMGLQHAQLEKFLGDVDAPLQAWRRDGAVADLAAAIESIITPVFEHMAMEEERILPLATRYITQTEWDGLGEATAAALHENAPLVLGMVMYEGDPDVIQGLVAKLAGKDASALEALAAQAFAQNALQVYGTATPLRIGATPNPSTRSGTEASL